MPLHLIKLAVGVQSLGQLQERAPRRHQTRNFPRRATEILNGGSLYWVINRIISARQAILDVAMGERQDGTTCTDLILQPDLVPVQPRFRKPFQGWRYLEHADAPPDDRAAQVHNDLPAHLRRELAELGLL